MKLVRVFNWLLSKAIIYSLILVLAFSGYALWSNSHVYTDALVLRDELLQLKPVVYEEEEKPDFGALRAINPDVIGWITLPGTGIDYPILQGRNNMTYLNRDVYGNFSLAGSIYMDSRCAGDFTDHYSLIYGHHMENGVMLGDLDLFYDYEFFETNRSAYVVTEDGILEMTVLAVLEIPDSSEEIFNPDLWGADLSALAKYIQENAQMVWEDAMATLLAYPTTTQAVALATCADGETGTRRVIILIAHRDDLPDPTDPTVPSTQPTTTPPPAKTGDSIWNDPTVWKVGLVLCLAGLAVLCFRYWKRSKETD